MAVPVKELSPTHINNSCYVDEMSLETTVREDLVNTAVKFLCNPQVKSSSSKHQTEFLRKKGLTEDEIMLAQERADQERLAVEENVQSETTWQRVKRHLITLLGFGGLSVLTYRLVQTYKMWEKEDKEKVTITLKIDTLMDMLANNSSETKLAVDSMKDIVSAVHQNQKNDNKYRDIVNEIQSLKGVLLSSARFTPPPVTAVPSWQLQNANANTDESNITNGVADINETNTDNHEKESDN